MFCTNCGSQIENDNIYCSKCGTVTTVESTLEQKQPLAENSNWWERLGNLIYIVAHVVLAFIILIIWSESYDFEDAFGATLSALFFGLLIFRSVRAAIRYVAFGKKPTFSDFFKFY